ncbi:MAG: HlyD family efflux transporter periplasmic adaptor subunit [Dehalococcoidia bacterium]
MQTDLSRKETLDKSLSPERLDALIEITGARDWLTLLALALLLLSIGAWAVIGRLPVQVSGQGILLPATGLPGVFAPVTGLVGDVLVRTGDRVAEGQAVVRISRVDGPPVELFSPTNGVIIEISVLRGALVQPGDPIARIEPQPSQLLAIAYLNADQGNQVSQGMRALVSPSSVPAERYGAILGTVAAVSPYPVSQARLELTLENQALIRTLAGGAGVVEVVIDLERDPRSPSGFRWTSPNGPPTTVTLGTLAETTITLRSIRPIQMLLPVREP